jgi:hypothetical protein
MSGDRKPNHSDPSINADNAGISRRNFLRTACSGAAVVGGGIASMTMPSEALAQYWGYGADVWKSKALYQNYPNGPARCAGCLHFRPPASCQIVEPWISPNGWCRFFSPIPVIYAPPEYVQPEYPAPGYRAPGYPWRRPYRYY